MDVPNYILRANEAVLKPQSYNIVKGFMRVAIWIIVLVIIIGSIIFKENLIVELSWIARFFLLILFIGFGFYRGNLEYTPSPMELQFYDEYLVFYLPNRYYGKHTSRKQINTMKYSEITKCVYKEKSMRIQIYGNGHSVWFNYKKDGSLPEKPTKEIDFQGGMIYFCTRLEPNIDFIKEIEDHSPLKVVIEND